MKRPGGPGIMFTIRLAVLTTLAMVASAEMLGKHTDTMKRESLKATDWSFPDHDAFPRDASQEVARRLHERGLTRLLLTHAKLDSTTFAKVNTSIASSGVLSRAGKQLGRWVASARDAHLNSNYLPATRAYAVVFGLCIPSIGKTMASVNINGWAFFRTLFLSYVFFLQGFALNLSADEIKQAAGKRLPWLFGFATNFFVGKLMSLFAPLLKFLHHDLRMGFIVWCNMWITTSSGYSLAVASGGDAPFALQVIVASNVLGAFTLPFTYKFFFSKLFLGSDGVQLNPFPMMIQLLGTVILPTALGAWATRNPDIVRVLTKTWATEVKYAQWTALSLMPMMAISGASDAIYMLRTRSLVAMVVIQIALHFAYLAWPYILTGLPWLENEVGLRKSLMWACSQRQLPLSTMVISLLPDALGSKGRIVIPCIIGLYTQFITDLFILPSITSWTAEMTELQMIAGGALQGKLPVDESTGSAAASASTAVELAKLIKTRKRRWFNFLWTPRQPAKPKLVIEANNLRIPVAILSGLAAVVSGVIGFAIVCAQRQRYGALAAAEVPLLLG